jgi:hypothetical protein
MKLSDITEKQKQIIIAVIVVVAAIGIGYTLGKRPAGTVATNSAAVAQQDGTTTKTPAKQPTGSPAATTQPTGTTPTTTTTKSPTTTATEPVAAPAKKGTISLAAKSGNGGITFSWATQANLTAPWGYAIAKSTTSAPSFPRDEAKFVADPAARSYTWDIQDGGTYWFKICSWNGKAGALSGCLTSSNVVKATAPSAGAAAQQNAFDYNASQLGLSGRAEQDGVRLFWSMSTVADFTSYRVVRSTTDTNLYYPKTTAVITQTNKDSIGGFDTTPTKGAKYFYRVCVTRSSAIPQCGNVWSVQY